MKWLNTLPGSRTEAPGLERRIWHELPSALLLASILGVAPFTLDLVGSAFDVSARDGVWRIIELASYSLAGLGLSIGMLALGAGWICATVMLMKGPAYIADAYYLFDRDTPAAPAPRSCASRRATTLLRRTRE